MKPVLSRLGQRGVAILVILASLLATGGWYLLWYTPAQAEIRALEEEISRLDLQVARGRQAQRALPQLEAAIQDLEAQRAEFLQKLPPRERFADVLEALSNRAAETGVTVRGLARSLGEVPVEGVRTINLTLELESPFPELFVFLREIERMRRFSTINGLTLNLGQERTRNPTLNANLSMTVYVFERAAGEEVER